MQDNINYQFQEFLRRRNQLINLIKIQQEVADSLGMERGKGGKEILKSLSESVRSDSFKVLVIGEFKRGKSTFINSLLGKEILPAYAKPCTAIINEVKWGEEPRALLHYVKGENGVSQPPQEIPVDSLEKHVVIPDGVDEREAIHNSSFDKVELFWPLEICKNGVEIIDSPGLNEHDIRQKITIDYLSSVDAVLFVLACDVLASQSELSVIDNIREKGHEDIFFICNRINLIRDREKDSIKQHAFLKLSSRTRRGKERIFFINAVGALDGRLDGDDREVENSGVPLLEKELEKFLTVDRGRVKLLRPATELKTSIQEARRIIPERRSMYSQSVQELEEKFENAQQPLLRLEAKRQQINLQFRNFCDDTKLLVQDRARLFYGDVSEKISNWVKNYKIEDKVVLIGGEGIKTEVKKSVEEIVSYLTSNIEAELLTWHNEELQPFVTERFMSYKERLDSEAKDFIDKIDELRLQISGIDSSLIE